MVVQAESVDESDSAESTAQEVDVAWGLLL
jgi:hypothetical protein